MAGGLYGRMLSRGRDARPAYPRRMNATAIFARLAAFPAAVRAAIACVSDADLRFKPSHPGIPQGPWCILEILNHLADEETDDFRIRLTLTLSNPAAPWPAIDPQGWAVSRSYLEQDPGETLDRFTTERARSVQWLRSLRNPDWTRAHNHPKHGPIRAGDLLSSWAAHDALHLRQIAKRLHELAARDAPEFSTRYAGEWGP